jgi:hypothetical protein
VKSVVWGHALRLAALPHQKKREKKGKKGKKEEDGSASFGKSAKQSRAKISVNSPSSSQGKLSRFWLQQPGQLRKALCLGRPARPGNEV